MDHSTLLRHNARALANRIVCYIPLILEMLLTYISERQMHLLHT
jgi:hypothetical protein